ncbi:hypothetical protein [Terrabacter sp. Soil810]|uniref:hypothetical protein n=1 Tax=Terrabacter sp. Soil810 TaxID=1736418 RepID=UPI00138F1869|nr:hypothetical protein [Terrabacter sp. Soil810]
MRNVDTREGPEGLKLLGSDRKHVQGGYKVTETYGQDSEPATDSVASLAAQLADPTLRRVFVEALAIHSLLSECVIDRSYTIPDTLAAPARLSPFGRTMFDEIRAKNQRLKPNDVKFSIFMGFGCPEGILIDPSTDLAALRSGITTEISKQRVLFPYIFGRELHDRTAARFPEKRELSASQTIDLLKELPVGVFQAGYTTVGPFGCIESLQARTLEATLSVPGYYCSDETCEEVHRIKLNTSDTPPRLAPANKTGDYVTAYLADKYGGSEDPHARLISEAFLAEYQVYNLEASEAIIETVVDGLNLDELRAVAEVALKEGLKAHGAKSLSLRLGSVVNNPAAFVAGLSTPHLIQLLLIFPDAFIIHAVDACVSDGTIAISEHEVRVRRIDRFGGNTAWAEIGRRGIRVTGKGDFVANRLMEMLRSIYYDKSSASLTPEDLAYLVGPSASNVEEDYILDYAVRGGSPEELLRNLVLGSRAAVHKAGDYLHVSLEGMEKDEMLETLLWKLGASTIALQDDLGRMKKYEEALSARISEGASQDAIRAEISNLFASLEGALRVSLEFCTWTLTNDHFLDDLAFVYDPQPRPGVLAFIEKYSPATDNRFQLDLTGKNTLSALGAGFSRLAKAIDRLAPDEYLRPTSQIPAVCRETNHPFAFPHTIPFFDLSTASKRLVLDSLNSVSRLVQDEVVLKVRNATIHGDTEFPSVGELGLGLEKLAELRHLLSRSGFYPTLFKRAETVVDELGRAVYSFHAADTTIVLNRPSWAIAPKMPNTSRRMIAVPACDTMASGPLRFSLHGRMGDEPYWKGWPKRWSVKREYGNLAHDAQGQMPNEAVG